MDLARSLYKAAYITGEFKLRSGKTSHEYFDKYRFESQPLLLKEVARQMARFIPKGTDYLAGLELGGVPVATALSLETGIPAVFVRKEAKDYGTCQFAEGADIQGRNLCVIEDVITTGGQVIQSTSDLRNSGAHISTVLCVLYRGEGAPQPIIDADLQLFHLFTMKDLKGQ